MKNLKVNHTSHDFRHSKVTDLLNEGMQLKEVATYVGHSNPGTTLKYFNVDQASVMDKVMKL
jgi:site-specific recombinase XerD